MSRSHNARTFNEPLKDRSRLLGRHTTLLGERLPHSRHEMSEGPRGFALSDSTRFPLLRDIFISDLFPRRKFMKHGRMQIRGGGPPGAVIPASD